MGHLNGARTLPKRLKRLKETLIAELPVFPNNKETKIDLNRKSLPNVLVDYLSWRSRLIGIRPRTVFRRELVAQQLMDQSLQAGADSFLDAIERGDDVSSHHSKSALKKGYTSQSRLEAEKRWADKDKALNLLGIHHFHIGLGSTTKGLSERSNELIFARVGREEFHVLGVFNHDIFDDDPSVSRSEYGRLRQAQHEMDDQDAVPGLVRFDPGFGGAGIANSGHAVAIRFEAARIVKKLWQYEELLADQNEMAKLGFDPHRSRPYWRFNHMDLELVDDVTKKYGVVREGPN